MHGLRDSLQRVACQVLVLRIDGQIAQGTMPTNRFLRLSTTSRRTWSPPSIAPPGHIVVIVAIDDFRRHHGTDVRCIRIVSFGYRPNSDVAIRDHAHEAIPFAADGQRTNIQLLHHPSRFANVAVGCVHSTPAVMISRIFIIHLLGWKARYDCVLAGISQIVVCVTESFVQILCHSLATSLRSRRPKLQRGFVSSGFLPAVCTRYVSCVSRASNELTILLPYGGSSAAQVCRSETC